MRFERIANSLITRVILIATLLSLVGTGGVYFQLSKFLRENLTRVLSAQQLSLADYVARDVDFQLQQRRRLLERLAITLPKDLLRQPARLRDWLKERHELLPFFSAGLMIADKDGKVLAHYPPTLEISGLPGTRELAIGVARGGLSLIGTPLRGPVSKQAILPMAAPLKNGAGEVAAVLIGITSLAEHGFLDRLLRERTGQTGGLLLISPRDKLFVASSDPAMVLQPTPPPGANLLHDRAMAGFRGTGSTVNAQGVEEIAAMSSVTTTGWFVVARLPTAEALTALASIQAYFVEQSAAAIAMVILVFGSMVAWMLRPLHRAADQAEKMTQDEVPLTPLRVIREDEVGHLTAAFNRLLAKLGSNQAKLAHMALHDVLTGLPNRQLLADRMRQALARAQRNHTRVAVLFLDLDGFKRINDKLGHEAGDEALKEIARRLQVTVRQSDTLARLGGDEFVLLVADLNGSAEEVVGALAEKCIAVVTEPLVLHGESIVLGVSIGIALALGDVTPDRLLVEADRAMYEAKQNGGGRYLIAR